MVEFKLVQDDVHVREWHHKVLERTYIIRCYPQDLLPSNPNYYISYEENKGDDWMKQELVGQSDDLTKSFLIANEHLNLYLSENQSKVDKEVWSTYVNETPQENSAPYNEFFDCNFEKEQPEPMRPPGLRCEQISQRDLESLIASAKNGLSETVKRIRDNPRRLEQRNPSARTDVPN